MKMLLLVQSVLTGNAQRAEAALDTRVGLVYDALRKAVLETYGTIPEEYRRQFRDLRQQQGGSSLDLCLKLMSPGR